MLMRDPKLLNLWKPQIIFIVILGRYFTKSFQNCIFSSKPGSICRPIYLFLVWVLLFPIWEYPHEALWVPVEQYRWIRCTQPTKVFFIWRIWVVIKQNPKVKMAFWAFCKRVSYNLWIYLLWNLKRNFLQSHLVYGKFSEPISDL